jgi:hypothetical protein
VTVHLTHRELYGTRAELLGGLAVVFAPPLLGLYSLRRYPLVDAWDPLYIVLALGGFLLTLPPLVVYRHTLFRWGHKLPAMQWIGIAALAVLAAMLALGIGLIANGALDRGDRATLEAKVVRKWRQKGNYHLVLAPGTVRTWQSPSACPSTITRVPLSARR